ncbi:hypothetical protein [Prosthecomicrobium sp. N25]|uniref:hypothetical protein n=1 Tax=Prosthecomicrobium sp. N25 TaxID=3129254 RepID=UPI003077A60E
MTSKPRNTVSTTAQRNAIAPTPITVSKLDPVVAELKRTMGKIGNLAPLAMIARLFPNATPEQIARAVLYCLARSGTIGTVVAPGGGLSKDAERALHVEVAAKSMADVIASMQVVLKDHHMQARMAIFGILAESTIARMSAVEQARAECIKIMEADPLIGDAQGFCAAIR